MEIVKGIVLVIAILICLRNVIRGKFGILSLQLYGYLLVVSQLFVVLISDTIALNSHNCFLLLIGTWLICFKAVLIELDAKSVSTSEIKDK